MEYRPANRRESDVLRLCPGARPGSFHSMSDTSDRVRIDKWLWAARFFKTRSAATEAVDGGKVEINGERAKPAKAVKAGDEVRVRLGPYEHLLIVRGVAERRGSAAAAQELYEETAASVAARARIAEQMRLAPGIAWDDKGRPTKKDRRDLNRFRER